MANTLAMTREAEPPCMETPPVPSTAPRLDVLVVDDEEDARKAIVRALGALGHSCRQAACGFEAARMLDERRADVVVCDWDLPGMNGADLCRISRVGDDEAPYTYFIVMTGFDDREHLLAAMEAGADDYQKKPIDLDELEARMLSAGRVVALHRRLAERTASLRHDSRRFFVASRTDPLTGVGNRLALQEEIEAIRSRANRYGHHYSLAICDVDWFKAFNDSFGHVAGDVALERIAGSIRRSLRVGDGLYRYGGEEFVVLLPEQRLEEAARVLERVRAAVVRLAIPTPTAGGLLTLSAGVAELEPSDTTRGDWLGRADAALYGAKSAGRNRVAVAAEPG
jgi:diguanylate cyclase (GGDEF)-like protein